MRISSPAIITVNGTNVVTAHDPATREATQMASYDPASRAHSVTATANLIAVVKASFDEEYGRDKDHLMLYDHVGRPFELWNSAPKDFRNPSIWSLSIHPTKPIIAVANPLHVGLWDVSQVKQVTSLSLSKTLKVVRFMSDGHLLFGWRDGSVSIYTLSDDFQQVSSAFKIKCHERPLNDTLALPGSWILTASDDETVGVWDAKTGQSVTSLSLHTRAVQSLALHPSGEQFASASDDRTCAITSVETFDVLLRVELQNRVYSCVFGVGDILYAGVSTCGVFPIHTDSGAIDEVLVAEQGTPVKLAVGVSRSCLLVSFV